MQKRTPLGPSNNLINTRLSLISNSSILSLFAIDIFQEKARGFDYGSVCLVAERTIIRNYDDFLSQSNI